MNKTPSSLMIALSIWVRTILLNALLIGIYMFFDKEFEGALFLVLAIIFGFFGTLPIFAVMPLIINLAAKIPYKLEGRLAGLTFLLIVLALLFYAAVSFYFGENLFDDKNFQLLVFAAVLAVV
jgi:hypothetical protein